jgi:hypothetical protein
MLKSCLATYVLKKLYQRHLMLVGLLHVVSCAGPNHPFGSGVGFELLPIHHKEFYPMNFSDSHRKDSVVPLQVEFFPKAQNFHQSGPIEVKVKSPQPLNSFFQWRAFYNETEITEEIRGVSREEFSSNGKQFRLKISRMRFLPGKDNHVVFYFRQGLVGPYMAQEFATPSCPIQMSGKKLILPEGGNKILPTISEASEKFSLNSALLAGLIAQESQFNPKAVSHAKALGLTQVTNAAALHVRDYYPTWPLHQSIEVMQVPHIKFLVAVGGLNGNNDWRLNSQKSILGGASYLDYIQKYWGQSDASFLLSTLERPQMEDIVLASYHSGPYRVKNALRTLGEKWAYDPELTEARKYVGKVKSYCYHYSN